MYLSCFVHSRLTFFAPTAAPSRYTFSRHPTDHRHVHIWPLLAAAPPHSYRHTGAGWVWVLVLVQSLPAACRLVQVYGQCSGFSVTAPAFLAVSPLPIAAPRRNVHTPTFTRVWHPFFLLPPPPPARAPPPAQPTRYSAARFRRISRVSLAAVWSSSGFHGSGFISYGSGHSLAWSFAPAVPRRVASLCRRRPRRIPSHVAPSSPGFRSAARPAPPLHFVCTGPVRQQRGAKLRAQQPVVLFSPFCVPAPRAARRSPPQVPRHTPAPPPHPGSAPPMYGQSVLVVLQVSGRNCHALVAAHAADHVPSVNATVLTPPIMFLVSMHRFKFQCS